MSARIRVAVFLAALIVGAYVFLRVSNHIGPQLFGVLSFGALAALEAVIATWFLVRTPARKRLALGHALVAAGCVLLSLSSLANDNLVALALGAPLFVVGMLTCAAETQTPSAG